MGDLRAGLKTPRTFLLLRKSGDGDHIPVVKDSDFPMRFRTKEGREYTIVRTSKGGIVMTGKKTE